jgi:hypothetical protein
MISPKHIEFGWQEYLFIAVFIFIAIVNVLNSRSNPVAARKRREEFSKLARRLDLTFNPAEDYELVHQFDFLKKLAQGENRFAYNVLSGKYQNGDVLAFDYHYEDEHQNRNSRGMEYRFSVLILRLAAAFPDLTIRPENLFAKAAGKLGADDIKFESVEFSKTFHVNCPDKKFAYDICNARMMAYLLANRDLNIEIKDQVIALVFDSFVSFNACLSIDKIELNLNRLVQIRSLMPEYLFNKA